MKKKKFENINCELKRKSNNQSVEALKFRTFNEIDRKRPIQYFIDKRKTLEDDESPTAINEMVTKLTKLQPNFSFEYSYPAVIFDKVCFQVDKSQQQANFLNECIFKLKNCIGSSSLNQIDNQKVDILKSINLKVPYGCIFGLLGPSSCGKTTLLRCLVGLLKPNSGSIKLFGHNSINTSYDDKNGERNDQNFATKLTNSFRFNNSKSNSSKRSNECKVPGSNVGYMPQDLGIYEDFTIRQLLTMFGQYVGMDSDLIKSRISFMTKFLDLPEADREICTLSGGQKRRVSFAIACLHMPPLIILDEPTVGVDPLLRRSIWKYLRRLADEERKTIIITTHYIEEAAQADQVALMRAGEILVQDKPRKIMELNGCKTLEEAFLKICNNIKQQNPVNATTASNKSENETHQNQKYKLYPQPRFNWHDQIKNVDGDFETYPNSISPQSTLTREDPSSLIDQLRIKDQSKKVISNQTQADSMKAKRRKYISQISLKKEDYNVTLEDAKINKLSMTPDVIEIISRQPKGQRSTILLDSWHKDPNVVLETNEFKNIDRMRSILNINNNRNQLQQQKQLVTTYNNNDGNLLNNYDKTPEKQKIIGINVKLYEKIRKSLILAWALLYKNYRRNVNSLPLLAFQFMLPIIQMISFSLCVGGRPSNIGLGLVNYDQAAQLIQLNSLNNQPGYNISSSSINFDLTSTTNETNFPEIIFDELLSTKYLSFIDQSMISLKSYNNLKDALEDVRKAKLWAAMEIGENFTSTILRRFDLENFYQLDLDTIKQSVIKLYPDRSNKVLDMICHRSLVNSYRQFLSNQFEHFKKLPIEIKEPIFDIKQNLISNSIDGYTESIAAGLLASLTYIMAAGLTTFIMVVERSKGILERTYTSGINPVAYLLAHAIFRSLVMMAQIAVVMFLTFYILQQPLVGSGWLAYLMLMTLNLTGISYGLLISSIVTDQNGAALTIVSSLVVKITMSGILWPFEAIPRWLRTICYIQPLTMPVQALKTITLKGNGLEDRTVYLGFLVSITWLVLFLTISAKRFKFYQH